MSNSSFCQDCGVNWHPGLCGVCYIKRLREEIKSFRGTLKWYAGVPRDENGATMPLDLGERAKRSLEASYFNDEGEIKNET